MTHIFIGKIKITQVFSYFIIRVSANSAKDALDGWDTYAGWEMEGFQRASSTTSLERVHVKLAAHSFASKMFARGI